MEWRSRGTPPVQLEPEILPPAGREDPRIYRGDPPGQFDQPPAGTVRRRPRNRWATAPATYILVGVNCVVYLAMLLNGVYAHPTLDEFIRWGANCGPCVLLDHQWWRLITAAFVHEGLLHIATNMWCLWNLGLLGEPLLGAFGTFAVYLLTGVAGNLLSVALHPGVSSSHLGIVSMGASGAVFGLAGVLIMLLNSPLLPFPSVELRQLRRSVIYFAILNFVLGGGADLFFSHYVQIDNLAHLGGFACGLALGVPLVPRIGASKSQFILRQRVAYGGMLLLTLVVAFGIFSFWRSGS